MRFIEEYPVLQFSQTLKPALFQLRPTEEAAEMHV